MPTVKWVPRYIDRPGYPQSRDDYHEVPIITLDDLEAWLKQSYGLTESSGEVQLIDDLLAQVQTMKEGRGEYEYHG